MRISVDKTDAGYSNMSITANVYLDGVKLKHCITADEECNEVLCYAQDESGNFIRFEDEFMVKTMHGVVRIEIPK